MLQSTFFNFRNKITLKDEFTTILKHMSVVKQSPFALIVQPIIQRNLNVKQMNSERILQKEEHSKWM